MTHTMPHTTTHVQHVQFLVDFNAVDGAGNSYIKFAKGGIYPLNEETAAQVAAGYAHPRDGASDANADTDADGTTTIAADGANPEPEPEPEHSAPNDQHAPPLAVSTPQPPAEQDPTTQAARASIHTAVPTPAPGP